MTKGRVAVIGGSIAGCAAAVAIHRAGADQVTVFERSKVDLKGRGVGLVIHSDLHRELESAGYLDPELPYVRLAKRKWITRKSGSYDGQVVGTQDFDSRSYDWGSLWQMLRDQIPCDVAYRTDFQVISIADAGSEVTVTSSSGTEERFDAVVGADGYRSTVRASMFPEVRPQYAGYLLWRGTLPAADLPEHNELWEHHDTTTVAFSGGHLVAYLMPGRHDGPNLNWAVYSPPPPKLALQLEDPTRLPLGAIEGELLDYLKVLSEKMPPYWRDVLGRAVSEEVLVRPIYDMHLPACVSGRLALVGDAAAVARPHTGGGAVKALQDAVTLQSVLSQGMTWPDALRAYDAQRSPANWALVELGRALGSATVLESPDWREMSPVRFPEWWANVISRWTQGGFRLKD